MLTDSDSTALKLPVTCDHTVWEPWDSATCCYTHTATLPHRGTGYACHVNNNPKGAAAAGHHVLHPTQQSSPRASDRIQLQALSVASYEPQVTAACHVTKNLRGSSTQVCTAP